MWRREGSAVDCACGFRRSRTSRAGCPSPVPAIVAVGSNIEPRVMLAAKEARRYFHRVYGALPEIMVVAAADLRDAMASTLPDHIVLIGVDMQALSRSRRVALVGDVTVRSELGLDLPDLRDDEHVVRTVRAGHTRVHVVGGASALGALYAAYQWVHALGVRFFLKGDVIPSTPPHVVVPNVDIVATPEFSIRGLQPFHDFFEVWCC